MTDLDSLAFGTNGLLALTPEARAAIRASEDVDALLSLKARFSDIARGRSLWVFAMVLLGLGAINVTVTFSGEGYEGLVAVLVLVTVILLIVAILAGGLYRGRARMVDPWLAELDYRLAQLAAQSAR